MYTNGDNFDKYWIATYSKVFPFALRACRDSHIALTEKPGEIIDGKAIEIIIGQNLDTRSHIRVIGGTEEVSVSILNILSNKVNIFPQLL